MKLPLLNGDTPVGQAMATLVEHGARGAVVRVGSGHRLVLESGIAAAICETRSSSLAQVQQHLELGPDTIVRIEGGLADIRIDEAELPLFTVPLYVCPERDFQSRNPGKCPFDGETLEPVA
jgi:hypothetical protein